MKIIKVVDEDTLEMKDVVIEDDEEVMTEALSKEEIDTIADIYRQALPCKPDDFENRYRKYKDAKAEFDAVFDAFKANLIELHRVRPDLPKRVIIGGVKVTYVSPSIRTSIDSKKLKEEEPELAKRFSKTSTVSANIRLEDV